VRNVPQLKRHTAARASLAMMRADSLGPASPSLIIGDVACATVRDDQFSVVRRADSIPDGFLAGKFDFKSLSGGGGKGGDVMGRSTCGAYFVKTLNTTDGGSLLREEFLKEYVARATCGQSLLAKIFAVVDHPTLGRFIVMANCVNPRVKSWSRLYDLKGTADDKTLVEDGAGVVPAHKRFYRLDLMTRECFGCIRDVPIERQRYLRGKREAYDAPIYLTSAQREEVLSAIKNDTALFEKHRLMDYSMIVGVQRVAPGTLGDAIKPHDGDVHGKPYVVHYQGETLILYFGIIDFLQPWNSGKKVAHVIKKCFAPRPISTVNPTKYSAQFNDFFAYKLKGVAFEHDDESVAGLKEEVSRLRRLLGRTSSGATVTASSPAKPESPSLFERLRSTASGVTVAVEQD